MNRIAVALLSAGLALTTPQYAQARLSALDRAHIHAVENGLLPAILIKSEPVPPRTLATRMQDLHVPGVSVAFFENGRVVWAKGYGYADVEHKIPVTPTTLFQAASISKPVSAVAALRLVQDGALNLDDDVNLHLKDWQVPPNSFSKVEKVTLRRLLSHTAGLTVHGFGGYNRTAELPTLAQILDGQKPANSEAVVETATPGAQWAYSGGGYVVTELLMQEASGLPFADLMLKSVLEPVGMDHSTYEQPLPNDKIGSAALGYRANGQLVDGGFHVYPEQAPAGLWTTPSDLAKLAIELQYEDAGRSARILNPLLARTMLTPVLGDYGLGVNLPSEGPRRFGHGGANEGYRADFVAILGDKRQGYVIMTNSDTGADLAAEIARAIAATYGWTFLRPEILDIVQVEPSILTSYAGTFEIPSLAKLEVTVKDGRLFIATPLLGPKPVEARNSSPTKFFILDAGLSGEFQKGADGSVSGMALKTPYGPFVATKIP